MKVEDPNKLPPNFGNIFENPKWVFCFHYLLSTGLTPREVQYIVKQALLERVKEGTEIGNGQLELPFEDSTS